MDNFLPLWLLKYKVRQTEISSFWSIICPFSSLTTWKIKILTLQKTPGDIIILQFSTINDNHMMYGSWDMEHDRHNFLSFWTIFCFFTLLWIQKIKILKKWKKTLKILSFYKCAPQMTVTWCMVPEIGSATDIIFCHFVILKQPPGDIIWHMCTINYNHIMYGSWDTKCKRKNFLSLWTVFCPPPLTTQKIKILKNWKKGWRYHHFTQV